VAALLRYLNFDVILVKDASLRGMASALDQFQAKLAGGVDIGLFFYSGHGQQNGAGRGFVLPTDVPERLGDANLQEYALAVEYIRNRMVMEGRARLNILVLDACRNNPGVMGVMSPAAKGLGSPPPAVVGEGSGGTVIAYATEAGHVSYEGPEDAPYSIYTGELLKALAMPGMEVEQAFALVTKAVGKVTGGAQKPKYTAGVYDDFRLVPMVAGGSGGQREEFPSGRVFKDCDQCPEMVVVPAGEFLMGSPEDEPERSKDEGPRHKVTIARPFAVGKVEVTFAEWDACVAGGGCNGYEPKDKGWGRGRRPVIYVSWDDAKAYVAWLTKVTGKPYRLLTEAEWEYAARAGTTTPFSTGQTITTDQANFYGPYTYNSSAMGQSRGGTMEVGAFPANRFGLHDMHGNVREWVEDCYVETYDKTPQDGTAYTDNCSLRVLRGGSWGYFPGDLRSAKRLRSTPDFGVYNSGFRVARTF